MKNNTTVNFYTDELIDKTAYTVTKTFGLWLRVEVGYSMRPRRSVFSSNEIRSLVFDRKVFWFLWSTRNQRSEPVSRPVNDLFVSIEFFE